MVNQVHFVEYKICIKLTCVWYNFIHASVMIEFDILCVQILVIVFVYTQFLICSYALYTCMYSVTV